ncbi:MAG: PilZ domain-containing protein [Sphingomonadales bacterium]
MMKLVRSPDLPEAAGYAASEKRYSVVLRAEVSADDLDTKVWVRVINISAGGLMVVAPMGTELSGHVTLYIRHLGRIAGRIAWAKNNCFGVKFDEAVDPEAMMSERAMRARVSADESRAFVQNSASVFVGRDAEDEVLPFVAMMQANTINRAAA